MSDDTLTTRVLIEIRDEIRELRRDTNARFDETNARLDQMNTRLDGTNDGVGRLRTELKDELRDVDIRAQTRMVELIAATRETNAMLANSFALRDRVEQCERDIDELKKRVG